MSSSFKRRLVAGDERGFPITLLVSGCMVVGFAFSLSSWVGKNTWTHDFFFKRSFVQWVLLTFFSVGLVHLLRRVPAWLRERRALRLVAYPEATAKSDTLVGRRLLQLDAARKDQTRKNLSQYSKVLAEHDEAEIDAAYRLSGDIVQILPLIGFFGTVFGLSHGLYQSFLATGGTATKDFAKAIAIAFDNTLLGLALTIILFVLQSVLRKRDDAVLLELNLQANDAVATGDQAPEKDPVQAAFEDLRGALKDHERVTRDHIGELEKARKAVESPVQEIQRWVQAHTSEVVTGLLNHVTQKQVADQQRMAQAVSAHLQEQSTKVLDLVSQRTLVLAQLGDPIRAALEEIRGTLCSLLKDAQTVREEIGTLVKNDPVPPINNLASTVNSLVSAMSQRDAMISERLNIIEAARAKLESVATETRATALAVASFGTRLDAVPDERRKVEDLAASIKELASSVAQHDSAVLENVRSSLDSLRALEQAIANETHSTAQIVAAFGARLDAVPEERHKVETLAASIKELASVLVQRDSAMLDSVRGSLEAHARDLKDEIRLPRTINFVEAPHLGGGDGETRKK